MHVKKNKTKTCIHDEDKNRSVIHSNDFFENYLQIVLIYSLVQVHKSLKSFESFLQHHTKVDYVRVGKNDLEFAEIHSPQFDFVLFNQI